MGGTLCCAAGLVPEIADDMVDVDRAMRGLNWAKGRSSCSMLSGRRVIRPAAGEDA
jgi:hypothetical protein